MQSEVPDYPQEQLIYKCLFYRKIIGSIRIHFHSNAKVKISYYTGYDVLYGQFRRNSKREPALTLDSVIISSMV